MFKNKIIIALLCFSLFLVSCAGGEIANNDSSNVENSNDTSTELNSDVIDTDDPDIIVSNEQPQTVSSNVEVNESSTEESAEESVESNVIIKEYDLKTPPVLDEGNIVSVRLDTFHGMGNTHYFGKENAQKLARFLNDSKFKYLGYRERDPWGLSTSGLRIWFTYADGGKVSFYVCEDATTINGFDGSLFEFSSSSVYAFIHYELGVNVHKPTFETITEEVSVIPELQSRMVFNAKPQEDNKNSEFPVISSENLAYATIFTRATKEEQKRIVLENDRAKMLIKHFNDSSFELSNFTNNDFTYDYGDYFRIVFTYKDGKQTQISFDGFYHINDSAGYFKLKEDPSELLFFLHTNVGGEVIWFYNH